jgi:hypothetical protein
MLFDVFWGDLAVERQIAGRVRRGHTEALDQIGAVYPAGKAKPEIDVGQPLALGVA